MALKVFWVSMSSCLMSSILVVYSPTFWRMESWSRSIIFSILFKRSSINSILDWTRVRESTDFSSSFLRDCIFSATICSAISEMVSEERETSEGCWYCCSWYAGYWG